MLFSLNGNSGGFLNYETTLNSVKEQPWEYLFLKSSITIGEPESLYFEIFDGQCA